ncbi:MAG: alpha-amylase/4-alpha-glucanotransferase domain-containing protein [Candidatus Omnitrophota bacterium]
MKKAKFAMAFHCYQPVFNFDREIERAFKKAYLPLLKTLEEFPGIKASFHYSGNMLEWFERRRPEFIEKMKKLMRRRQIELIGGGCFEPVMALIPERDRKEQLKMNEEIIARIFGTKPAGAWLAERVWEPTLADTLASAGVKYTILDDYHLLQAGVEEEKIFSPYLTRGEEGSVILFPALTRLRYSMPFCLPKVTLDYMKAVADKNGEKETCFFFADDGEKFGLWPHTYWWVHKKGWLRDFFTALEENAAWLQTATYSEIMNTVTPENVDKVPESSYAEMMEWSGGGFKNFLKKYPEAERMHRRMISVSDMVGRIGAEASSSASQESIRQARKELFKAQSGCAYWHGTFGGLYLPHLRSGVYEHLIKAQNIVDAARNRCDRYVRAVEHDLADGKSETDTTCYATTAVPRSGFRNVCSETVLGNKFVDVFVKSSGGGGVSELDYKPLNVNLVNTMSRVKEDYHKKLTGACSARTKKARETIARGEFADIHDVLGVGERGLRRILSYDDYQRASFLTHIFGDTRPWREAAKSRTSNNSFLKGAYVSRSGSKGDFITYALSRRDKVFIDNARPFDLEVVKKITVGAGPAVMFSHSILKHSGGPLLLKYGVEFNFLVWDKTVMSRPRFTRTDRFSLKDRYSGLCLDFFLDREAAVFMQPIYTVNETDSGLRKTFQGISLLIGDQQRQRPGDAGAAAVNITIAIG